MKNWFKTMLCAVSAATLVACGGGDYVDPNPAAPAPAGGTASASAITGIAGQMELAAGLTIDGIAAGFFGNFTALSVPTGLESPADMGYSAPTCANDGTAVFNGDTERLTYVNCVIDGSTLNGVVKVEATGPGSYKVTYNPVAETPLTITAETDDGKTATFTYTGNQVISDLDGDYYTEGGITGMNSVTNGTVKIGSASAVTLTNFEVDFRKGEYEIITIDGKYSATIKLSDFGVPVTPPMPESVALEFTVTTPTPVKVDYVADKEIEGIIKFASTMFSIETNYATRKITLTVTGAPAQEFAFE